MRSVWLITLFCCAWFIGASQTDSTGPLILKQGFDIPKTEKVEFFKATGTASPVIFSNTDDAIFIRPIDLSTGLPIRLLSIRSNASKKVEQHVLRGDSIFCLVKSVANNKTIGYESVIYTLTGDELAEAHRHKVNLPIEDSKKNIHKIFFTAANGGKKAVICQQNSYVKGTDASLFLEVTQHPDETKRDFTLPLPYESEDLEIVGVSIDDSGTVYIGAKAGVKLNSPFLRKYLIYAFDPAAKELHEFDMSRDKVFMQDMLLKTEPDKLNVMALYSDDPFEQNASTGYTFMNVISSGSSVDHRAIIPFQQGSIDAFIPEEGRALTFIDDVFLNEVFNVSDAQLALFDKHYQDQVCTTDPRTGIITCTDQFHYDGILVENVLDPSKSAVIGRRQIDYNKSGPYIGHQSFEGTNDLLIFYNDHFKNETINAERIMNNPARSAVRFVRLNKDCQMQTGMLTDDRQSDFVFMSVIPGYAQEENVYLIFSNGREFKVGEINGTQLH